METNKTQIVFVHGGDSFATREEFYAAIRNWTYDPYKPERKRLRDWLAAELADTHELIAPAMPCKQNADYVAWCIWFEKVTPYLRDGVVLIGHSLGGGFLLRYLTEYHLPVTVAQLHLVAPCIDQVPEFGIEFATWSGFATAPKATNLWHSTDDTIVPIAQSEQFKTIYPEAELHTLTDRFHFLTETFPKLLNELKK
jgi:uncharacterized protein